eukprot:gb/GFBE01018539.1/.p1 GENE.gb/GFBE01018539.1/~~gb/GFBE01018539.1/.p1  ORF type:complete len:444 (+),score=49.99 gb/GFBE01018539.1/:1-1332(+)
MSAMSSALLQTPAESARPPKRTRCCDYSEPSTNRDTFLDNFKGMASLCIVFIHFGTIGTYFCGMGKFLDTCCGKLIFGGTAVGSIFAMPCFCFVSGYVSSLDLNKARRTQLLRYAVTWVVQHGLFFFLLGGRAQQQLYINQWEDQHPDLNTTNKMLEAEGEPALSPPGPLPLHIFREASLDWYLWCVILWRLCLPLIDRLRHPFLLSVVISLVMMFTDSSSSTYSNAPFGFLPYFILGYQMKGKRENIDSICANITYKVSFILFLLVTMAWSFFDLDRCCEYIGAGIGCLYGGSFANLMFVTRHIKSFNATNAMLHPTPSPDYHFCQSGQGALLTLLFYTVSMASVFGCMTLVPKGQTYLLTRAGRDSIYIYFGQLWIITLLTVVGFVALLNKVELPPAIGLAIGIIVSLGSWAILAQPCVKCLCSPCIEPRVEEGCCAVALP